LAMRSVEVNGDLAVEVNGDLAVEVNGDLAVEVNGDLAVTKVVANVTAKKVLSILPLKARFSVRWSGPLHVLVGHLPMEKPAPCNERGLPMETTNCPR
jgi:hypothetical protein